MGKWWVGRLASGKWSVGRWSVVGSFNKILVVKMLKILFGDQKEKDFLFAFSSLSIVNVKIILY